MEKPVPPRPPRGFRASLGPVKASPKAPEPTAPEETAAEPTPLIPRLPSPFGSMPKGRASTLVQTSLLGALQGLQELATQADAEVQAASKKHLQNIQAALRHVAKSFPAEDADKTDDASRDWAIAPERTQEFGQRVEQARRAAGLSRAKLAERAGLSEQTISNVETATNIPTHATVVRLLSVPELALDSEAVPWRAPEAADLGTSPNCWIAPSYEPLKMFTELFELLNNSRGGSLEQTYAYLDHQSAMHWFELSNQASYATTFRDTIPFEPLAQTILASVGRAGIDVMALGSGDGKHEVRLVQHLLANAERRQGAGADTRLFLLDISQPLLSSAYQHAAETLGKRGVYTCAIQGNFHHWPQYAQFHHSAERSHRRRIAVMFGNTLGNLDNEARFFRHTLIGFAPGDLLLLDVQLAYGSPDHPDEIMRNDPAFTRGLTPLHKEWLGGPLMRYCRGAQEVEFTCKLDLACQIPGCYTVDTLATVKLKDGREKRFSVFRFKRYDPQRLADMLRHLGWELLEEIRFGSVPSAPTDCVLLLRRLSVSFPG